jgi:hypothetical protein
MDYSELEERQHEWNDNVKTEIKEKFVVEFPKLYDLKKRK